MKVQRIKSSDQSYPSKLTQLSSPPQKINIAGGSHPDIFSKKALGVIGSRKATPYGRGVTESLAGEIARSDIVVVSGLALGIDSIAHKAALDADGHTIAVLPGGLDEIYPATHRSLAKRITENNGLLVSEQDDRFRPRIESFIQRNRIIAALSDALLITEAAEKSGSLHTANFALELGKPVLCVPGNINSPTSTGTNNLIKSGAALVTSEKDIYSALGLEEDELRQGQFFGDTEEETTIINLIQSGITAGEEIHIKSNMPIDIFQQTLTMLEIKGVIRPLGNNYWGLG